MLEKAVGLNPQSHFPYSVLGEAYLIKNEDSKAEFVLKKAIDIEQTSANLNNLGVALYSRNNMGYSKKHLIEEVGVKRIESRHDPRNTNSCKVMLKCGLQYEGTLRHADINNQGICDAAMYALLSEDYYMSK